jgi:hypothetical protein
MGADQLSRVARRGLRLFGVLVVLVVALGVAATPALAKTRSVQRLDLLGMATKASNSSLKYLHGTWWKSVYRYTSLTITSTPGATETLEVADPAAGFSAGEVPIRSQASALYATALSLKNGTYSVKSVGVSAAEARRRVTAWTNGLAYSYQVDGWGHGFQSALWVYYLAYGAHQNWTALPQKTRDRVDAAVASECNYLLAYPAPFYQDASGTVLHPGDSKSEENAWNGTLLLYAARAYPTNPNATQWDTQGRTYNITAYSSPSQVGTDPRLTGSNINADGSVTNGGRAVYPDYIMTQSEFIAKCALMANMTKTPVAREIYNNQALTWRALTKVKYLVPPFVAPGGTIYRMGSKSVTANIYFPSGTSRSRVRKFNAAQSDVEAFASRLDSRAYDWAKAHLTALLAQQKRHKDGRIFSTGETKFPEDEQFAAASEAEMVSRLQVIK